MPGLQSPAAMGAEVAPGEGDGGAEHPRESEKAKFSLALRMLRDLTYLAASAASVSACEERETRLQ